MSQALSNLAIGSKVKFGSYSVNGETAQPIVWTIVAKNHTGYPDNSVTLHTSEIIDLRCFDAKEPNNSNSSRVAYGNNYYSVSNIDQWLNKDADGGSWYVAAHGADSAPDTAANTRVGTQYAARPGFLNAFTTNEKNAILSTTIRVVKPTTDGGSYEDIVRKVFLPSITEMGYGLENNIAEGTAWGYYTTATTHAAYATAQCYSNTQSSSKASSQTTNWQWWLRTSYATQSHYARLITSSGGTSSGYAYSGQYGIRPALNLSNALNVSDSADSDGCYTFEWSGSSGGGTSGGSSSVWVGGTETYTENETRNVEVSLDKLKDADYADELVSFTDKGGTQTSVRVTTGTRLGTGAYCELVAEGILTSGTTESCSLTFTKALTGVKIKCQWEDYSSDTDVTDTITCYFKGDTIFEKTGTSANHTTATTYILGNIAEGDVLTVSFARSGTTVDIYTGGKIREGYRCYLSSDPITITETVPVQKTRGVNKPVSSIYAGVTTTVPVYSETTTTEDIALSSATFTDFFSASNTGTTGTSAKGVSWADNSGGGLKLTFGNYGINSSTSMTTFTAQRDLTNVVIKGLYYTESNYDKITLTVAGTTVLNAVSGTSSSLTQRWSGSLAKGQTIVLKFVKDSSQSATNESSTYFTLSCDPYQKTVTTQTQTGTETKLVDKKIVKGYVGGPDGKAKVFYSGDSDITYTGKYFKQNVSYNGEDYVLYGLTSSGTLTTHVPMIGWACGGGAGGMSAYCLEENDKPSAYFAGVGGASGYCNHFSGIEEEKQYIVSIGIGGIQNGSGGATSVESLIEVGGGICSNNYSTYINSSDKNSYYITSAGNIYGGNGTALTGLQASYGAGWGNSYVYKISTNLFSIPFNITSLQKHCASGAGGTLKSSSVGEYYVGYEGGSNGLAGSSGGSTSSSITETMFPTGGVYGGGNGGSRTNTNGQDATFYGAGGGGGRYSAVSTTTSSGDDCGTGGAGYQGIVYLLTKKDKTLPKTCLVKFSISMANAGDYWIIYKGEEKIDVTDRRFLTCLEGEEIIINTLYTTSSGGTAYACFYNGTNIGSSFASGSLGKEYHFKVKSNTAFRFDGDTRRLYIFDEDAGDLNLTAKITVNNSYNASLSNAYLNGVEMMYNLGSGYTVPLGSLITFKMPQVSSGYNMIHRYYYKSSTDTQQHMNYVIDKMPLNYTYRVTGDASIAFSSQTLQSIVITESKPSSSD